MSAIGDMAMLAALRDLIREARSERDEMLAAMEELLSGHDNLYVAHFGPNSNPLDDIAAKAARAAISKAESRS